MRSGLATRVPDDPRDIALDALNQAAFALLAARRRGVENGLPFCWSSLA
jgi:hypothetical protein